MPAASRSPLSSDWRDIASLGEQIVNATSLAAQRDYIVAMTSRLVSGDVDVWLDEKAFRLPNMEEKKIFPDEPELPGMQRALKLGEICTKQQRAKDAPSPSRSTRRHSLRSAWAAVPLIEQGLPLGAIQVTRKEGPEFKQPKLDALEELAGSVTVSLIAWHLVAVEL